MSTDLLKVILVDDELLAIEHLRHLVPWHELGFEIVAETTYPQQAVELHRKHRADIVFVDIKMPGMDGLTLSRALLSEAGGTKIVLLTSYKEFDYAKEAIKLGISEYLVKHELSADQLTSLLRIMKDELLKQDHKERLIRRQLFLDLVKGVKPLVEQKRLWAENMSTRSQFLLMLIGVDLPVGPFSSTHPYAPPSQLQLSDEGTYEGIMCFDAIQLAPCRWGIIATVSEKGGYSHFQPITMSIIRDIQQRFKRETGETISAVVSSSLYTLDEIKHRLMLYERTLAYAPFYGREIVMHPETVIFGEDRDIQEAKDHLEAIRRNQEHLDYSGAELIAAAFELEIKRLHIKGVYWLGDKLLNMIHNFRAARNLPLPAQERCENYTFLEMSAHLQALYRENVQECQKLEYGRYSRKVRETLHAIDTRYSEGLTIEELAEQVGISGDRLRRTFKQETGTSALDYLTQVRIREAKKLLQLEKYKIGEVAEMVGYRDSQYFSQVFRKAVGVNPLMYVKRGGH
ncbi:hypothetical protein BK133_14880 [Paenibacillus sp. FSL H8-0548]|uniref:response regulator n=1 Tax=Paenibacillus sp. FSL H8-0548 TaxID=1920422 RepID=UPI00096C7C02|nr:response regulator [Paenibacillus sp. FSL H8-0548]OMF32131.1 hypothetical protein BK133_14880 [Paenibacillus sp. FSL H8-0548]